MITEDILNKFIDIVAEDIYLLQEDSSPEKIEKFLEQIKQATMILDANESCGCTLISKNNMEFSKYVENLVNNFWSDGELNNDTSKMR